MSLLLALQIAQKLRQTKLIPFSSCHIQSKYGTEFINFLLHFPKVKLFSIRVLFSVTLLPFMLMNKVALAVNILHSQYVCVRTHMYFNRMSVY